MQYPALLLLIAASNAFGNLVDGGPSIFDLTDRDGATNCDAENLPQADHAEVENPVGINRVELAAFSAQDNLDSPPNSTASPELPLPGLVKIGYGGHWQKGFQHWVAFPLLGVVACKQFVDLGRMSVGQKHGACQTSFKIANKWYEFNECNPIYGLPKYLLDEEGVAIASCAAKKFEVLCVKEGKIWGMGTCEDPPPDELVTLE